MTQTKLKELLELSKEEKIELVQTLWDSIADEKSIEPVSDKHKEILQERIKRINSGRAKFKNWEDIKSRYLTDK